jgi:hypothetical protein
MKKYAHYRCLIVFVVKYQYLQLADGCLMPTKCSSQESLYIRLERISKDEAVLQIHTHTLLAGKEIFMYFLFMSIYLSLSSAY